MEHRILVADVFSIDVGAVKQIRLYQVPRGLYNNIVRGKVDNEIGKVFGMARTFKIGNRCLTPVVFLNYLSKKDGKESKKQSNVMYFKFLLCEDMGNAIGEPVTRELSTDEEKAILNDAVLCNRRLVFVRPDINPVPFYNKTQVFNTAEARAAAERRDETSYYDSVRIGLNLEKKNYDVTVVGRVKGDYFVFDIVAKVAVVSKDKFDGYVYISWDREDEAAKKKYNEEKAEKSAVKKERAKQG